MANIYYEADADRSLIADRKVAVLDPWGMVTVPVVASPSLSSSIHSRSPSRTYAWPK